MIPAAGAALAYGIASALDGSGFIAAFVAGMVFRLALGRDPEELNQLTEEVGSLLNGVTFVLFGAILLGPALDRAELAARPLRGPQPHARADAPGRDRDVGLARPPSDARLPRLVRPPRAGVDRLRGDRHRGVPAAARAPDRARDLPHRRALGPRPRPDRRAARRPLRPLVRAAPAREGAADGERPGRGDATARTGRPARARRPTDRVRTGIAGRHHRTHPPQTRGSESDGTGNQRDPDLRRRRGDQPRADHRRDPDALLAARAGERTGVPGRLGRRARRRQRRRLRARRPGRRRHRQHHLATPSRGARSSSACSSCCWPRATGDTDRHPAPSPRCRSGWPASTR